MLLNRLLQKAFLLLPFAAFGQTEVATKEILSLLKSDVVYLASDELEGREAGTQGEALAADYIAKRFSSIGLEAFGGDTSRYFQWFEFAVKPKLGEKNNLKVEKKSLELSTDFYPLSFSANAKLSANTVFVGHGIDAPDKEHNDYKGLENLEGKVFVIDFSSPDGKGPHSEFASHLDASLRAEQAEKKGAAGVIFINPKGEEENPDENLRRTKPSSIPVVFVASKSVASALKRPSKVALEVEIVREKKWAKNVVGFVNNLKPTTVVIGAHYDHLGYGEEGSRYRGEPLIHNGADDNASGVAAIIELARRLKDLNDPKNNFLFVAFSGEEKGLLGSNYFVKNAPIDLLSVNYMINLDMVGRLDTAERTIAVNGVGTSKQWQVIDDHVPEGLKIKKTASGVGASDHTSFYLNDIPVLHFFSGTHGDYHKPADDSEKINYRGMLGIIDLIESLVLELENFGKLDFQKTKDQDGRNAPRFSVTLGVIPDYLFDGEGMRIDGVSADRPAEKAKMKVGDVVVKLGDHEVRDMMTYMKALSQFKKGDKTKVVFKRENQLIEREIKF